jgi:hypothetical protein
MAVQVMFLVSRRLHHLLKSRYYVERTTLMPTLPILDMCLAPLRTSQYVPIAFLPKVAPTVSSCAFGSWARLPQCIIQPQVAVLLAGQPVVQDNLKASTTVEAQLLLR